MLLFLAAILIGAGSMLYTNHLVRDLSKEERQKVELWAEAIRELQKADLDDDVRLIYTIIKNNKTIPLILTNENDSILNSHNLDSAKINSPRGDVYLKRQLRKMKEQHEPITIHLSDNEKQFLYYKDSILLVRLFYYPFVQLTVICLFIFVSYLAFSTSRKSEQNQVWVGMSKETAHQLGTPISSLIAWLELLKMKDENKKMITEVEKDIQRLRTITDRFSKIGSPPVLKRTNIIPVIYKAMSYIKSRTSSKIQYVFNVDEHEEIMVPLNVPLFEWVIENLCKNAVDAMNGQGTIEIQLVDNIQVIYIDMKDTGKGMSKSKYKTVFQPGYTTKNRGWGLGLSLSKRIIEINHGGKIFVKSSEISKGSVFRIVLKK